MPSPSKLLGLFGNGCLAHVAISLANPYADLHLDLKEDSENSANP